MKENFQLDIARELLAHTAREIGNDYKLRTKLKAVCFSYNYKIEKPGCIKCLNDAMDFLARKTGINRHKAKKHGKVLSAV